ncbi:glycosyltransferase [Paludisphaera rhizosphaerae]|uniref:glycosyltransferase n=1 Tax=Paludisphaera rhizosphaerae TaxID=2711216 RepID=UPI0013ED8532|nr:glycosyltransferase [Paludisphaera rhizosphaerae]
MGIDRVLFASVHGYVDPSSGAAVSTRELMELLAAGGIDARVLSTGLVDFPDETPLGGLLDGLGTPYRRARAALSTPDAGADVEVFDLTLGGVRVALMPTAGSRIARWADSAEAVAFLDLADQVFARFRPQVMFTYGGHVVGRELMARARRRGIAVVFHLRNFEYSKPDLFRDVSALVVTTEYARRHYAEVLGRDCVVIPNAIRPDRVVAADRAPRYLTFVNPQLAKGAAVFARIAAELGRRRPDIPMLVLESRARAKGLERVPLDLSGVANLHRMANTPDPRDFYGVSRAVLIPSLVRETFGRVAAEAMSNGLPVLASDRGALPEVVGDGGFVLPVPPRLTPSSTEPPTAEEVAPWLQIIERLWDDPAWEAEQSARALAWSRRWDEGRILEQYHDFFRSLA